MIIGFHVDLTSAEMLSHLQERAKYHAGRATWYAAQEKDFASIPAAQASGDPVKGLQEAGKRHKGRAEIFAFLAEHVPSNEVFRLDNGMLANLEFISERLGW
jgi:cytochrome c1